MTPGKPVTASTRTVGQPIAPSGPDATPDVAPVGTDAAEAMREATELALLARAALKREHALKDLELAASMTADRLQREAHAAREAAGLRTPRPNRRRF